MKKNKDFTLIEGEFTPQDAKEVLINLYSSKLNFHAMKNFSSNERLGKDDDISIKRIQELKKSILHITEMIDHAVGKKKKLVINAVVSIQITANK